eukprot:m.32065 g.32065  ORF g.32065 m.32065 type:complete len:115 (+) comp9752_c0_seq2:113-457(+)
MSTMIMLGLGVAAVGFGGKALVQIAKQMKPLSVKIPKLNMSVGDVNYYRGGFQTKMTKREAAMVLGCSPKAPMSRISELHKKVMVANHPDRGGSPYLASKINEAKELLEKSADL